MNRETFPTIFRIAVDYISVQATSVPAERVFSSAAETDTRRRNRISPHLFEALQMLKYSFKSDRLNFTEGWETSVRMLEEPLPQGDNLLALAAGGEGSRGAMLEVLVNDSGDEQIEVE